MEKIINAIKEIIAAIIVTLAFILSMWHFAEYDYCKPYGIIQTSIYK